VHLPTISILLRQRWCAYGFLSSVRGVVSIALPGASPDFDDPEDSVPVAGLVVLPPAVPPIALPASGTPGATNEAFGASGAAGFTADCETSLVTLAFGVGGSDGRGAAGRSHAASSIDAHSSMKIDFSCFIETSM
jgi:hypothetical protein